ncbi:MBL fold metallo-hydrolase [Sporosarcina sp. 179-K 3D1 HS]|uniref:MBL fold metallo-hydrolase n=1 Tax=Sporosarcina sp. 179-K 3D1 HS TaxID=3232169 RepID=UPI0039A01826
MLEKLGIETVRIDLPFRLNHVNCFMAEGETGWTVIDAGLNNTYTQNVWKERIGNKKVSDLFITHYHPDHFGHAGQLQQWTGARVSMSEIDARSALTVWEESYVENLYGHYKTSGIPEHMAREMVGNTGEFTSLVTPYPTIGHYFKEGEKLPIGRYEYEIIHAPGHSDGMVCFYNAEESVLISADHILPKITPNISYWFHGDDNPLQSYLASLESIKRLDIDFVIPSHGKPFHGANGRIDEIIRHHEDRLEDTLRSITDATTVYEACGRLFKMQLTVHETRFAIGETIAHLEYLRRAGECDRKFEEGQWIYYQK